jgi:hypothetical protein
MRYDFLFLKGTLLALMKEVYWQIGITKVTLLIILLKLNRIN